MKKENSNFFMVIFLIICKIGSLNIEFFKNLYIYYKKNLFIINKIFTRPIYLKQILNEFLLLGVSSIPIVSLTGLFTGSVLAIQTYIGFSKLNNIESIPLIVSVSIVRELGPVLTALMLSGRISSGIASEIGSMKISNQIDAMKIMGISHIQYLFRPKLIAIIISIPILTLTADFLGIVGGFLISVLKLNFNPNLYKKLTYDFLSLNDVLSGIYKSFFFGLIIVISGYINGISVNYGSDSVSKNTKNAVVISTILILFFNYILTSFFLRG